MSFPNGCLVGYNGIVPLSSPLIPFPIGTMPNDILFTPRGCLGAAPPPELAKAGGFPCMVQDADFSLNASKWELLEGWDK
jgi:hypothetical protein